MAYQPHGEEWMAVAEVVVFLQALEAEVSRTIAERAPKRRLTRLRLILLGLTTEPHTLPDALETAAHILAEPLPERLCPDEPGWS